MASRFDSAPLQDELDATNPRWRKWFQDIWSSVNALSLPFPTAITIGVSPWTYQFLSGGQASILVNGGTVSLVEWSRDGTTFFAVAAATNTMIAVSQKDFVRVTYTAAPTVKQVLR